MISTNLSTRPFYNERLVHTLLAIVAVLVLALTALNARTFVTLSSTDREQNAQAARAEKRTEEARKTAERIRKSIDAAELQTVTAQAAEADVLIGARTFSWTQLLAVFERTLPADVRIGSVTPVIDKDGAMSIQMTLVARRAEDVNEFVERLETQGGFSDVVPRQEALNTEGLREVLLVGRYAGTARHGDRP